jgi:hypothetical protein
MDKIKSKSRKNSKNKNNRKLNEKNNTPTKKQKFKTNLTKSPKHFDLNDEIYCENNTNLKRKNIDKKNLIIQDNQSLRKLKKTKSDYSNNSFNEKLYDNDEINEDLKLSEKLILQQQLQTAQAKIYLLEQERDKISKTIDNTNNNNILFQQIQNLKTKIDNLENDNNVKIKNNKENKTFNNFINEKENKNNIYHISDKIYLLLKILRKYAKKFNTLISLCENNEEVFEELKLTIEQYNNVVFNEKLQKIFNFSEKKENDINEVIFALSEFEPQSFDLYSKYQNQIKELQNKNELLIKKISDYEKNLNNLKSNNNDLQNLKLKNQKIKIEKNKIEENFNIIQQLNKDLNIKISSLKDIENKYISQENIIKQLKNKIQNLNNEINYKENTIHYLESLLQKCNLQQNNNNYNIIESLYSNKYINSFGDNSQNKLEINNYDNNLINQNINNSNQIYKSLSNKEDNNIENQNLINSNFENNNNEINFNSDINDNLIKKRELNKEDKKEKVNDINKYLEENINDNYLNNDLNEIVVTKEDNKNLNSNSINNEIEDDKKHENLQTEIEQLDQEIYNLKNKLKLMISNK